MKKAIAIILSIMLVLAITLPASAISTIAVKSIKLNNSKITLKVGQTLNLIVTFTPVNTSQKKLTYVTHDKYVATVDATGKIKAVHAGTTTITVYTTNKKIFAKCNVTISKIADPLGKYKPSIVIKRVISTSATSSAVFPEGETYEDNRWVKAIEEHLGIKLVTMWSVDMSQYNTKLSVSLASGDMPDFAQVLNYSTLAAMRNADALADLTQAWNDYTGPELKALGEKKPILLNAGVFGGKLLAIPNLSGHNYMQSSSLWIRKDWMDKLNIAPPQSMADVIKIAKAFTTQDPDGNGKNDTYGLALQKDIYGFFAEIFGFAQGYHAFLTEEAHQFWIKDSSGKYAYGAVQPEAKNALLALQDMYKKGYIAKDFAVRDVNKLVEDYVGGKVGMTFGQNWLSYWPFTDLIKKDLKAEFRPYAIPSVDDKPVVLGAAWPINDYWVVSKNCKYPEALIKMGNLFHKLSKEQPKVYNTTEDGKAVWGMSIMPMDDWETQKGVNETFNAYRTDPSSLTKLQKEKYLPTVENIIKWIDQKDPLQYGVAVAAGPYGSVTIDYDFFSKGRTMLNALRGGESETLIQKGSTLRAMELEVFTKIIMGESIDTFDKFVNDWNVQGGKQITKEVNAAKEAEK